MLRGVVLAHRQKREHIGYLVQWIIAPSIFYKQRGMKSAALPRVSAPVHSNGNVDGNVNRIQGPSTASTLPPISSFNHHPKLAINSEVLAALECMLAKASEKQMLAYTRASPLLREFFQSPGRVRSVAETLSGSKKPTKALNMLSIAHTLCCQLKQSAYECVAHHLASSLHWDLVLSVVTMGQRQTGRSSVRLLNWRVRALSEREHYRLLCNVLKEFKHFKLTPNRRTYHLILSGCIRNRDLAQAKECLQAMQESGVPIDASTDAVVAMYYRTFGADKQVKLRALESLPSLRQNTGVTVLNSLMQICLDSQDISGSLRLLSLFDRATFNVIATSFTAGILPEEQSDYLSTMHLRHTYVPNVATFTMFINYTANYADLASAIKIFHNMLTMGIQPNQLTVAALVHVLVASGQRDMAVRIVAQMCDKRKTPLSVFSPMMSSTAKGELLYDFSSMRPTVHVFNALLRGLLSAIGFDRSRPIIDVMKLNNVKPNGKTLQIFLAYFHKTAHALPSTLIHIMRDLHKVVTPTIRQMNIFLSSVLRREKFRLFGCGWNTYSLTRKAKRKPLPLDQFMSTSEFFDPFAGMRLTRHLRLRNKARPVTQSLCERYIKSDSGTIALRIRHDAVIKDDMDSALEVFRTLLIRGIHPNQYHYSALMEGYARSGNLEAATDVMRSAEQAGLKPNVVMFTILIVGYARIGEPDNALAVFRQMVKYGVQPDIASIDAVAAAFFNVGSYMTAKRVLLTLWTYIQPFPEELREARLHTLTKHFRAIQDSAATQPWAVSKPRNLDMLIKLKRLAKRWIRMVAVEKYVGRRRFNLHKRS